MGKSVCFFNNESDGTLIQKSNEIDDVGDACRLKHDDVETENPTHGELPIHL